MSNNCALSFLKTLNPCLRMNGINDFFCRQGPGNAVSDENNKRIVVVVNPRQSRIVWITLGQLLTRAKINLKNVN